MLVRMLDVCWYVRLAHSISKRSMSALAESQQNIVVPFIITMAIVTRKEAAIPPGPEGTGLPCRNFVKRLALPMARFNTISFMLRVHTSLENSLYGFYV